MVDINNIHIIMEYEKSPVLWNPNHPDYKKKDLKERIIQEIANGLGMTAGAVDAKWRCLRRQFVDKTNKLRKSGSAAIPEWEYTKYMQFLLPTFKHRQTKSNVQIDEHSSQAFSDVCLTDDSNEFSGIHEFSDLISCENNNNVEQNETSSSILPTTQNRKREISSTPSTKKKKTRS